MFCGRICRRDSVHRKLLLIWLCVSSYQFCTHTYILLSAQLTDYRRINHSMRCSSLWIVFGWGGLTPLNCVKGVKKLSNINNRVLNTNNWVIIIILSFVVVVLIKTNNKSQTPATWISQHIQTTTSIHFVS